MQHLTKLLITISLEKGSLAENETLDNVIEDLPAFARESFREIAVNVWKGEFVVSCEVAPELAAGDFVDDLSPYLKALLDMKSIYGAEYEMQISVGSPAAESFRLEAYSVAFLASIGAPIVIKTNLA